MIDELHKCVKYKLSFHFCGVRLSFSRLSINRSFSFRRWVSDLKCSFMSRAEVHVIRHSLQSMGPGSTKPLQKEKRNKKYFLIHLREALLKTKGWIRFRIILLTQTYAVNNRDIEYRCNIDVSVGPIYLGTN